MKIVLLFLSLFCFNIQVKASDTFSTLVVWAKDGSSVSYHFKVKPKISFDKHNLIISTDAEEISYNIDYYSCITFENAIGTGIVSIPDNKQLLFFEDDYLVFPDLKRGAQLAIYTLNGIEIVRLFIPNDGIYAYSVSNFSKGTYIVSVDGLSYKIVKK